MRTQPTLVNVSVKRGADFHIVCKVRDPADNSVVDITGSTIEAEIFDTAHANLKVADFTILESAPTQGEFFLHLPRATTEQVMVSAGVSTVFIQWPDPNGMRKPMFDMKLTFSGEKADGV